jgi:FkbM family methyltransferase
VEIYYDRAWIHRIGSTHIPVSDRFEYRRDWDSLLSSTFDPIEENWFFSYRPRPGDTIVDVGAGDGLDSMVFSRAVGPSGKVLAVEAHPATFVLLEQTRRLNGLENVTPCHRGVMDRPGSVAIAEEGSHRDFFSVIGAGESSAETKTVAGATLDDLCREHELSRVDFLKMNIEGAERYALQGGSELLQPHAARLYCVPRLPRRGQPRAGHEELRSRLPRATRLRRDGQRRPPAAVGSRPRPRLKKRSCVGRRARRP